MQLCPALPGLSIRGGSTELAGKFGPLALAPLLKLLSRRTRTVLQGSANNGTAPALSLLRLWPPAAD